MRIVYSPAGVLGSSKVALNGFTPYWRTVIRIRPQLPIESQCRSYPDMSMRFNGDPQSMVTSMRPAAGVVNGTHALQTVPLLPGM